MCSRCIRVKEFLNFIDVNYEEVNIEEKQSAKKKNWKNSQVKKRLQYFLLAIK